MKKSLLDSSVIAEFEGSVLPKIKDGIKSFFEQEFECILIDVNDYQKVSNDKFLKGEVFFTSEMQVKGAAPITIRLSSNFIRLFLHNTFGSISPEFKLVNLTELEVKIINTFCDHLFKSFENNLKDKNESSKYDLKKPDVYNFVIIIKDKNSKHSKIVLSIPKERLKSKDFALDTTRVDEEYKKITTDVDIEAGYSKITLNELKAMSVGDIMLLEKSIINKMLVKTGSYTREFKVNPDPALMLDLDDDIDDMQIQENKENNMWDDIQIEVNAQFKKVKMTLGELKQITDGLVIELGEVFENQISLLVEEKEVARGELVIINDKYAVKINEVVQEQKPQAQQVRTPQAQQAQAPQAGARPAPARPAAPQGARPAPARPAAPAPAQGAPARPQPAVQPAPQNIQAQATEVEEDFDYSDFEDED